jgi:glycosyltransferase involved in cell wall biosynthesis
MPEATGRAGSSSDDLLILIPLFNDWRALSKLAISLEETLRQHGLSARLLIVDDGSTTSLGNAFPAKSFQALGTIEILRLRRNLGHQRAIAVGLAYIEQHVPCQAIVVMDSDGEDDPKDIPRLLKKYQEEGRQTIVFAKRVKRSETRVFRLFYSLYKMLYYLLTNHSESIGNFSVIPASRLSSLVVVSEIWNHYAAAVLKSRQPHALVPTQRAKRLEGRPQMNFVQLAIHGLSAISVYSDIIGVRLLVATFVLIFITLIALACVVSIRLFTNLAIPGWATFTVGMLIVILLQAIMFSFVFSFIILGNRQGSTFLPLRDYSYFIAGKDVVYEKSLA